MAQHRRSRPMSQDSSGCAAFVTFTIITGVVLIVLGLAYRVIIGD